MPKHIPDIERALAAVGDLLAAEGHTAAIVIVGGAALNLLGVVARSTRDVDVLAVATAPGKALRRPEPLPAPLAKAVARVARDLELSPDWLNAQVAGQWDTGLPPGLETRVAWKRYGGLAVGIADRRDIVFFKLYAAADDVGTQSRHFQDLLALAPTAEELGAAASWVKEQDPSPDFGAVVDQVVRHAQRLGR